MSDIAAKKEMIKNGVCPKCNSQIDPNAEKCPICGYVLNAPQAERAVCTTCGSTLDANGICPRCSGQPQYGAPQYGQPQYSAPQPASEKPKAFNIFALLSLILSNVALFFVELGIIIDDEPVIITGFMFALIFGIPAFVFQFIARTKKSFILWKIFSWIAFATCILTFLLALLSLSLL